VTDSRVVVRHANGNWSSQTNRSKPQRVQGMREPIRLGRTLDLVSPFIKPATARPPEPALDSSLMGSGRQRDQRSEGRGERPWSLMHRPRLDPPIG